MQNIDSVHGLALQVQFLWLPAIARPNIRCDVAGCDVGNIEHDAPALSSMRWLVVSSTTSLPISMKALLSPTFATVNRLPNKTAMTKVVPATSGLVNQNSRTQSYVLEVNAPYSARQRITEC